ncbi:hypothetical protein J26TS2_25110 [Shouchella clausii]|nr:hypothetical protein J26TS2_25110 [Shouchella clausii]
MTVAISPEKAGATIAEWYSCIIARSVEQASQLKAKVDAMFKQIEKNERLLAYYALVNFRYRLMCKQASQGGADDEMLKRAGMVAEESVDHLLKYLYYFSCGQNEFVNERYRSAIRLFRKAERLLEYVENKEEEAEFHYYMGLSLYRISQYPFAGSYIEEALVEFNRLGNKERSIHCQTILGGIYSETKQYDKAILILNEALAAADPYPFSKMAVLRALGLNALRYRNYEQARQWFEKTLSYHEFQHTLIGVKNTYNLANTLYRLNLPQQAAPYLKKAAIGAEFYRNKEYKARCLATRGLYAEGNYALIDQAIEQLNEECFDFEVDELAEEAATYFEQAGHTTLALKYLKIAYQAKQNLFKLGAGQ